MATATASGARTDGHDGWQLRWLPWVTLVARLVLGGTFLAAGLLKVGNPAASARAVTAYQILPYDLGRVIGYALPWLEIAMAVLLIVGLLTRLSAGVLGVLLVAFLIGIASVWARGISIDCGCFGGGGKVGAGDTAYPQEMLRDTGLLLLAALLVWRPASVFALDGDLRRQRRGHVWADDDVEGSEDDWDEHDQQS
ncbi:MAG: DoxX family protein [Actinomycetes bacterium]